MQTVPEYKCASDIGQKESMMLAEVLKHYDFTVDSVEKVRSAYKVCTDKGIFCLKRVSHGYRKAKKSCHIMKCLKERNFDNLAEFYPYKREKVIIKNKEAAFYLTYWIEGREASFSDTAEILRCAELLALFHNYSKGIEAPKHVKIKDHSKKWKKTFTKWRNQISGFKATIDKLKLKTEFDYTYRSSIDYFYRQAELAVKILDQSRYSELCNFYASEGNICHDSFYYQNILVDKDDKMYIVDLESCQYDIPMSDLGKLISRILSKKKFKWDFDLCRKIIESYCKVRPMTREEYEILLAMLVFPYKFWKLGKKRYVKNKLWEEKKFEKKLKRLNREKKYKRELIYCYINFYGLNIDYNPDIIEN